MTNQTKDILIVEEVRELTPEEKKERNYLYVLNNLKDYIASVDGDFFLNLNEEAKEAGLCYISKEEVNNYEEIKEKLVDLVNLGLSNWELTRDDYRYIYKHKKNGEVLSNNVFSPKQLKKTNELSEAVQAAGRLGK